MTIASYEVLEETFVELPNGKEIHVELLEIDGRLEIYYQDGSGCTWTYSETNDFTRQLFEDVAEWLVQDFLDNNDWSPIDAGV
jgi:hypothetical protein